MTKKDYKAIASALLNVYEADKVDGVADTERARMYADVIVALCQVMKDDNNNFKADVFVDACYPKEWQAAEFIGVGQGLAD